MESNPKETKNEDKNSNNNIINEINIDNKNNEEEDINIEDIQKKLEEQEEASNNDNDLFSHNLDNMLENIACLIASEK
jgi:hypothetical protein